MQLNGFLNLCFYLFESLAGRYTARKIGNISCIVSFGFLDHYRITHGKVARFFQTCLLQDAIFTSRHGTIHSDSDCSFEP